ncbi:MAG: hypothetical protein ACKOXO_11930 [Cyanobium sp.]
MVPYAKTAYARDGDLIIDYARDDIIDLPGRFGRDGAPAVLEGHELRVAIPFRAVDWRRAEIIRPGVAGLIRLNDGPRTHTMILFNQGSRQIYGNEDMTITLLDYSGPVQIV